MISRANTNVGDEHTFVVVGVKRGDFGLNKYHVSHQNNQPYVKAYLETLARSDGSDHLLQLAALLDGS